MKLVKRKKGIGLSTKFNLLAISLILTTAVGIAVFVIRGEIKNAHQELINHGQAIADIVAKNSEYGVYTKDRESLLQIVEALKTDSNIAYIAIIDHKGSPLVQEYFKSTVQLPSKLTPEMVSISKRLPQEEFINRQDGMPYVDIRVPVMGGPNEPSEMFLDRGNSSQRRMIGYAQIGLTQEASRKRINQLLLSTSIFTSLITLLGIGLTLLITRRITFPIKKLMLATQEASEGNLDHQIQIETSDEISDLTGSFNHMLDRLKVYRGQVEERTSDLMAINQQMHREITERKKAEEELQKAHDELDRRVQERTEALGRTNVALKQEIIERKRAEEETAVLQEQLRQSQKMEAIGQLAGGVAHDFNNILTIINGRSELTLLKLKERDPLKGNIEEIKKAGDRAASLTRQLLAFSRRQILEFKVLDLNAILLELNKMLRRVIGEDIELVTVLGEDLGKIRTDPSQIEQVILNLAVNARDAMPNGGKLILETANVELDDAYSRTHVEVKSGPYVMLSVSDTGVGMAPEVKERIFEPFFTTKEKGKGTGLGLATVYGIVKQSDGNVWVYSELGHGTAFKIYLPRVEGPAEPTVDKDEGESITTGKGTILLVEDEGALRELTAEFLRKLGYAVLEAQHGDDALLISRQHEGSIELMLTDVVMPGMSGRELAGHLAPIRPQMKVLYMSGYTDDVIVHRGVLQREVDFVQKPFTLDGLSKKVRKLLDKDS
jgi:signal transduction histidine kinase/CheY-like chemotaxis protein